MNISYENEKKQTPFNRHLPDRCRTFLFNLFILPIMLTEDKPSDLINQAITNLMCNEEAEQLRLELYACLKSCISLEIKQELKERRQEKIES